MKEWLIVFEEAKIEYVSISFITRALMKRSEFSGPKVGNCLDVER